MDQSNENQIMNDILQEIYRNRIAAFSKNDSRERLNAVDKLRAFGLIEKPNRSWKLTKDGYKAVETGILSNWLNKEQTNSEVVIHNMSMINGNNNNVSQSDLNNSNSNSLKFNKSTPFEKKSWLEIASWIAGIIGTLIAIYLFMER